ncbi:histidine-containing phosphotransfer protein 5 [Citrus sinensis]|uniref:Histidine-containing phosphotransfer protein 5 n=1 Tax=Citrus sinensis TaxID=2711 RepID=A0ACB8MVG0_CITSI|nr:histidine-containing phosphotransfer protein 5 [Citrus sinensis]KAH9789546.1 histidine-containing phosphotransfer protein 5 [Citrus sinensis]
MENNPLHQQIATMRQSFLDEEILNDQFIQLESMATEDDPAFAEDTVSLYFQETTKIIATLEEEFIGASKVLIEVNKARACCDNGNIEGGKAALEKVKVEQETLKAKLDSYFQLVKQS